MGNVQKLFDIIPRWVSLIFANPKFKPLSLGSYMISNLAVIFVIILFTFVIIFLTFIIIRLTSHHKRNDNQSLCAWFIHETPEYA